MTPYDEGYQAGIYAKGTHTNPYLYGTIDYYSWQSGYYDGYNK